MDFGELQLMFRDSAIREKKIEMAEKRKQDNIALEEAERKRYYERLYETDDSVEEYNRFRLNPQLLSTILYNTPNLSHLILYLNRCSEFEFDFKQVRLIPFSVINDLFKRILSHEENNVNKSQNDSLRG